MIKINSVTKKYDTKYVLNDFNLELEKNKITVVLGESGSGKTTLLNVIAGLTDYSGEVIGVDKPCSMVFQTDRLIPNLTAEENLRLICDDDLVLQALDSVNMLDAKDLYPKSLSAGMKRRIAILRALIVDVKTMFLDEPFVNLDVALKYSLIERIKNEQKTNPKTVIMVTHDVKEAVLIADRVVVIKEGKVVLDERCVNKNTEDKIYGVLLNKTSY